MLAHKTPEILLTLVCWWVLSMGGFVQHSKINNFTFLKFLFSEWSVDRTQTVGAPPVKPPLKESVGMCNWHHITLVKFKSLTDFSSLQQSHPECLTCEVSSNTSRIPTNIECDMKSAQALWRTKDFSFEGNTCWWEWQKQWNKQLTVLRRCRFWVAWQDLLILETNKNYKVCAYL